MESDKKSDLVDGANSANRGMSHLDRLRENANVFGRRRCTMTQCLSFLLTIWKNQQKPSVLQDEPKNNIRSILQETWSSRASSRYDPDREGLLADGQTNSGKGEICICCPYIETGRLKSESEVWSFECTTMVEGMAKAQQLNIPKVWISSDSEAALQAFKNDAIPWQLNSLWQQVMTGFTRPRLTSGWREQNLSADLAAIEASRMEAGAMVWHAGRPDFLYKIEEPFKEYFKFTM
ncbi:hypothetical protein GIB67_028011 [Kingdonia uniflora]|uniref:RNase H type-1 domain-containing protein n=1 Tax=Kingdonia uniflora TaxID=39325 RepID=A0A7J7L7B0_9MAGN|nr:hypothetical protein GIB67_028011 [Kingdonia uniflora]